jgi:pyruvate kinase
MIPFRKFGNTKIICTIGPASQSVETLVRLIQAGMDVARLNFSHGTHDQHLKVIENIQKARQQTGEHIGILQDLGGPKIRTGALRDKSVVLREGSRLTITTEDVSGTVDRVSTTYKNLPRDVEPDNVILIDDGKISVRVVSKTNTEVVCAIEVGGVLTEHKGMNLPGVRVSEPSLTEKDIDDLKFGLAHDVDSVALSFVRSHEDVRMLRDVMVNEVQGGRRVPIVAKIEKPEAVSDIDRIIAESEGIMVARGDLGVEMPTEEVPIIQKAIVRKCNEQGVPVFVATQMLESMIDCPRPTRAEATDVANAVLDGADAVMLSEETSVGKYPVEAVSVMDRIIQRAEVNQKDHLDIIQTPRSQEDNVFDAVARSACLLAKRVRAKAIVPVTHSGVTALRISKYRPEAKIIAVTGREKVLRRLNIVWGVRGIVFPDYMDNTDDALKKIREVLKSSGYVEAGDYVVFTAGIPLMAMGTTNTVKVEKVD